jgi:hypothetical protein
VRAIFVLVGLLLPSSLAQAEKRIALLNGKKEYKAGVYCRKQYSP